MTSEEGKVPDPSPEEIKRVLDWLRFDEITRLIGALIVKIQPNEFVIAASVSSWADTLPPEYVLTDLQLWHQHDGDVYDIKCEPDSAAAARVKDLVFQGDYGKAGEVTYPANLVAKAVTDLEEVLKAYHREPSIKNAVALVRLRLILQKLERQQSSAR